MRRLKWFVVENKQIKPVKFNELKKNQTKRFGFFVPKTPRFQAALQRSIPSIDARLQLVDFSDYIAVIFEPEDGLWSARKLRMEITKNLTRR